MDGNLPLLLPLQIKSAMNSIDGRRSTSMPSGLVRRAHAILLVSEGKSLAETGRIVGVGRRIVRPKRLHDGHFLLRSCT